MKVVKIPVSNELLLSLLHLDTKKYSLHSATQDPHNPMVTNLFVQGEDLPEIEYGNPVPEATVEVKAYAVGLGTVFNHVAVIKVRE